MTDNGFRKRMNLVGHLTEGFEPETTQQIKELVVDEYLKGKTSVNRQMFDKIQEFLNVLSWETCEDRIRKEEEAELKPLRDTFTKYEMTMVYLRTRDEFKPLFIRCASLINIIEKCNGDETYREFLECFYRRIAPREDENGGYYIYSKDWRAIRRTYKEFLNRLIDEERVFYLNRGVFNTKRKIKSIKLKTNRRLEKMSEREKKMKVAFLLARDCCWREII